MNSAHKSHLAAVSAVALTLLAINARLWNPSNGSIPGRQGAPFEITPGASDGLTTSGSSRRSTDVEFIRSTPDYELSGYSSIGQYTRWAAYVAKVKVAKVLEPVLIRTARGVLGDAVDGFAEGTPSSMDGETAYFRVYTPILLNTLEIYKSPGPVPPGFIIMTEGGTVGQFAEVNRFNPVRWTVGDAGIVFLAEAEFDGAREEAVSPLLLTSA